MNIKIENSTEIIILIVFLFFVIYLLNCKKLKEGASNIDPGTIHYKQQYTWQELCQKDKLSNPCEIYEKDVYKYQHININNLETIGKEGDTDSDTDSECRKTLQDAICDGDKKNLYSILKNYNDCYNYKQIQFNGKYKFTSPDCDQSLFCETLNKFKGDKQGDLSVYGCPTPTSTPTSV
jgi:hypothetical protein